jgi:hypothetical protein
MRESDFDAFSTMLDDVAGLYPRGAVTQGQKAMFFRALSAHPLAEVRAGFDAHVKDTVRGRFLPMPADILAQIEGLAADDGRPGPEEAWAAALRSADESNTVVWTEEMSQAWAVAWPVLQGDDQVGARMAFKESYARMVDEARRARRPAVWIESLGFDPEKRAEALRIAHVAGRLPAPELLALPAPAESLAQLTAAAPEGARDKLRALRDWIVNKRAAPSADAMARMETATRKAETARAVAEYEGRAA